MHQLWLQPTQLQRGPGVSFPAGTLVIRIGEFKSAPIEIGIRVDQEIENGGSRRHLLTLSTWFDGRVPFGDLFEVPENQYFLGYKMTDDQMLVVEADFGASSAEVSEEAGGLVGWSDDSCYLLGYYGRNIHGLQGRGMVPINFLTWMVEYQPRFSRGIISHQKRWRLSLCSSKDKTVIVADPAASETMS